VAVTEKSKSVKPDAPDHLTMSLFAPGMTVLHRAGLGGLACTLRWIEKAYGDGILSEKDVPGGPWPGEKPPWEIDEQTVTLRFGSPEKAGKFLKRLFALAFQIKDGLIYLPGQYPDLPPSLAVRAELQRGVQLTFLQHGPTCGSRVGEWTLTYDVDDQQLTISYDVFTSYVHQGWYWLDRDERSKEKDPLTGKKRKTGRRIRLEKPFPLVAQDGTLTAEHQAIDVKIFPGAMQRHVFCETAQFETADAFVCLHFALVGCLALSVNKGVAVLIVPAVENLLHFIVDRAAITPTAVSECRIANPSDAALQAMVRLRMRGLVSPDRLPGCYAMEMRPTKWAKQLKSRVRTISVGPANRFADAEVIAPDDRSLDLFEVALALMPPRVWNPDRQRSGGKKAMGSKTSPTTSAAESVPRFIDSVVRPFVADNLAAGRDWYDGFAGLMKSRKAARALRYDKRGIRAMTQKMNREEKPGEVALIKVVSTAVENQLDHIKKKTQPRDVGGRETDATVNRQEKFLDDLRRSLVGAKTMNHAWNAICAILRPGNQDVRFGWHDVMTLFADPTAWQSARNLALVALAKCEAPSERQRRHPESGRQTETKKE
jgi:CRISPR-associated protein Cas8a1/Csx13